MFKTDLADLFRIMCSNICFSESIVDIVHVMLTHLQAPDQLFAKTL